MTGPKDLLTLAIELSMLSAEAAENLTREATRSGESADLLLARRGLLSPVQMDVLQTLQRPNDVIPGYELLSLIGHGGMGVVYRARQRALDRVVAVKTILVSQMSDAKFAVRFEQEARAVAKLHHPNIIQAIDFGQQDGRLFFVMEFVQGTDLESGLEQFREQGQIGGRAEELAWCLGNQTAAGLAHAAKAGIVHRDIKPANLLLVEPPAGYPLPVGMPLVKIADFGLAFLTNEADVKTRVTAANTAVGSPHYMAPEQLEGRTVDERADIYALGATLFHVLAGQPPFGQMSLSQVIAQKLTGNPPRVKSLAADVSDETDDLLAAMMARQPDQRIGTYSALLKLIEGRRCGGGLSTQLLTVSPSGNQAGDGTATAATRTQAGVNISPPAPASGMQTTESETPVATQLINPAVTPTAPLRDSLVPLPGSSRWSRRRWMWACGGVTTLAGVTWVARRWLPWNRPMALKPESLVSTGRSEPLFDGRSLKHWRIRNGTWLLAHNDDGAPVLAGSTGVIARRIDFPADMQPPPTKLFAIVVAAWLHQATAVELHFGMRHNEDNGSRWALRLEADKAWLVTRANDRSSPQPVSEPVPLAGSKETPREFRLVRGQLSWNAFVDEQLVGTCELSPDADVSEIRLLVESGPAWFADLRLDELRTP